MRVAANQFFIDEVEGVTDFKALVFGQVFGHFGIEDGLEDEVAQFFTEVGEVFAVNGVEDFVGLFESVFFDGFEGLFAIPGAAVRGAEAGHDVNQPLKPLACGV